MIYAQELFSSHIISETRMMLAAVTTSSYGRLYKVQNLAQPVFERQHTLSGAKLFNAAEGENGYTGYTVKWGGAQKPNHLRF